MKKGADIKSLSYSSIGSFEKIFNDQYNDLLHFAAAILFDYEEARDVVQDVFCKLWEKRSETVIRTDIRTYLFSSVKNACLNRIKHIKIEDASADRLREAWLFSNNIDPLENQDTLLKINKLADSFPPQMKNVFFLRKDYGLSYLEIAAEMNISVNSVKTHLKRAFSLIRKSVLVLVVLILYPW